MTAFMKWRAGNLKSADAAAATLRQTDEKAYDTELAASRIARELFKMRGKYPDKEVGLEEWQGL